MTAKSIAIAVPDLLLDRCTADEHCSALRSIRKLPYWWYQNVSPIFGNISLPFQDRDGVWWYQVKPGFSWAVDCFRALPVQTTTVPPIRSFLGYQHVCATKESNANLVINTILDVESYSQEKINAKRRNAVRKGLSKCTISIETDLTPETVNGCQQAWGELTARSGWKGQVSKEWFNSTWHMMVECPGTSIIVGRETETGLVAGFLIVKILNDTAYVDTIASRSDMLRLNINDAMMYSFLINARNIGGVSKAHYAIKSDVTPLEKFKTSLGFSPVAHPAYLRFRPIAGSLIRTFKRSQYERMFGHLDNESRK